MIGKDYEEKEKLNRISVVQECNARDGE